MYFGAGLADFSSSAWRLTIACDGIDAADVAGDVAVGDAADFQRMQTAEVGDLLEAEGGVVDQPDRSGLGHQNVAHGAFVPVGWGPPNGGSASVGYDGAPPFDRARMV